MSSKLALSGGMPVWTGGWPRWPAPGAGTAAKVSDVLISGRWTVSGPWSDSTPVDVRLATRFAEYVGTRWCLPVDHGSSALIIAMRGLGIGPGDEVIVPGLTWVACASAVARAGAVPILADIDPRTLCIDPCAVEAAIGPKTAAVLVVHLYSAMADMDALAKIAQRHKVWLIEDAAQAYGATWHGAKAGSLGVIGAFSTQQGKTLTSGEGGLFVTSDAVLRARAEMLRGDGRRYSSGPRRTGEPDLVEGDGVQGWNMHLSEFQAAILLDAIERLPEQNDKRACSAATLDKTLSEMPEIEIIEPYQGNDLRSYYHYVAKMKDDAFAGRDVATVCSALSAELGYWIHPAYRPLNDNPLYNPRQMPGPSENHLDDPRTFDLPRAHREHARVILLHHPMLLGDERHIQAIADAFEKVALLANQLPEGP